MEVDFEIASKSLKVKNNNKTCNLNIKMTFILPSMTSVVLLHLMKNLHFHNVSSFYQKPFLNELARKK